MSFFRNPELFLYYDYDDKSIDVRVFYDKFGTPIESGTQEYIGPVVFTPHLSLGDNKISDFDAFFDYLTSMDGAKFVNCQGLVICFSKYASTQYTWSPHTLDTSLFSLPAHVDPHAKEKELAVQLEACIAEANREKVEKQALENVIRELETNNSILKEEKCYLHQTISCLNEKVCALEGEVEKVKNEKNALIVDLDGKNIEILTLYKQAILNLKAKSFTLEGEIEGMKNEKDYIYKEEDMKKSK